MPGHLGAESTIIHHGIICIYAVRCRANAADTVLQIVISPQSHPMLYLLLRGDLHFMCFVQDLRLGNLRMPRQSK